MSEPQFFQTGMGRKYYESTLPSIARALERIAAALEESNEAEDFQGLEEEEEEDYEYVTLH